MEFRNTDSKHVDWVKALKHLFQQLQAYVKQHHGAGPAWNPQGLHVTEYKADKQGKAVSKPAAAGPASSPGPVPPSGAQQPLWCNPALFCLALGVCCTAILNP